MIPTIEQIKKDCIRSLKRKSVNWRELLKHALLRLYHGRMKNVLGESWEPCFLKLTSFNTDADIGIGSPWLWGDKWFTDGSLSMAVRDIFCGLQIPQTFWDKGRISSCQRNLDKYVHGLDMTVARFTSHWTPPYPPQVLTFGTIPGEETRRNYEFPPVMDDEVESEDQALLSVMDTEINWDVLGGIMVRSESVWGCRSDDFVVAFLYTWCPHPPMQVQGDYCRWAELYNLIKAGQLDIAADRMCDLDDPESFAYADTWRADPEIAHLSSEWLKWTFDYMSPERQAKFELTKADMVGVPRMLPVLDAIHQVAADLVTKQ